MKNHAEHPALLADDSPPGALSGPSQQAIQKAVLSQAVQHPATSIPLTIAVLALLYLNFFSQTFGWAGWALGMLLGTGAVAAGSFFWQYVIRFRRGYAEQAEQIRARLEQQALHDVRKKLKTGFRRISSSDGLQALEELEQEYEQLQAALERDRDSVYLEVDSIRNLAQQTYRQGLSVLADALELGRVIHSTSTQKLHQEIQKLERQIPRLQRAGQSSQAAIKQATLKSHQERLDLIGQQQVQMEKLLYQCDQCEASLYRTRLELANLKSQRSDTGVRAVTESLQQTIGQAKAVQKELKQLGF
jgi:Mg2+ and Co2+ transporter CorA